MTMNFRHFGGFPSRFGGAMRTGRLFRSAAPLDQLLLNRHDFRTILDLRHPDEVQVAWHEPWAARVIAESEDSGDAPHLALIQQPAIDFKVIDSYYAGIYAGLPFEARYVRLFGMGLSSLANLLSDKKALVCCSAGKDRTGMFIALFGSALGVSSDEILSDFLASGEDGSLRNFAPVVKENVRKASGQNIDDDLALAMLGVKPEYLEAFYRALDERCGGVEGYLETIGIDQCTLDRLRDNWLA